MAEALSLELALDPDELDESVPDEPAALLPLLVMDRLHDLVSRTSGSPLSPVIGSSRIVHVCSMGPEALFSAHKHGQKIETRYNHNTTYVCKVDCVCTVTGWVSDPSFWRSTREDSVRRRSTAGRAYAKIDNRCRSKHKDAEFLSIVL